MCGIFGWIKPTGRTNTSLDLAEIFRTGLVESIDRGRDATGYYAPRHGTKKEAVCCDEWVDENVPDTIANERFVLGHVRKASVKYGLENRQNTKNAQPYESKDWVLIHNGTIGTPRIKGYKYESETDSESIIAMVQNLGLKTAIRNIDAGSTVGIYDKKRRKLYFWTNGGRPLAIAYYNDMIFFASTKKILRDTLKVDEDFGIFPQMSFATIYEEELLEFDFNQNKFFRRDDIEYKPTVSKPKKKTAIVNNLSTPKTNGRGQLRRGCTSNPTQTQLALPTPNSTKKTANSTAKTVRISSNGGKKTYHVGHGGKITVH